MRRGTNPTSGLSSLICSARKYRKTSMLSEREVISTLNMLRNEHLDVRTVTLGVSLFDCVSHDLELFTANV